MPALALVDVLTDFGAQRRSPMAAAEPPPPPKAELQELAAQTRETEKDRIAAAVANAQAELAERLAQQHADEIAALRASHATEIERQQAELGETAGRLVAERIGQLQHDVLELT